MSHEPTKICSFFGGSSVAHKARWYAQPLTRSGLERIDSELIECRYAVLHIPRF
jgi:hypothetical protein